MKTKLLLFFITLSFLAPSSSFGQSVGFLGDFSGWGSDVDMETLDNVVFTKSGYYLPATGLKFRQDDAWDNNWGGDTFPTGTWSSGNIPVAAGFYDISIDIGSTAYSFTAVSATDQNISIIGDFNSWSADFMLSTSDNINYTAANVALTSGGLKFRRDGNWSVNFGGTTQSGTGVPNTGDNIPIPADGNYDISFNIDTLAYTIVESTLSVEEENRQVEAFFKEDVLTINGYEGQANIQVYDLYGRNLNSFENIAVNYGFTQQLNIPKAQMSFIVIYYDNTKTVLKVIN